MRKSPVVFLLAFGLAFFGVSVQPVNAFVFEKKTLAAGKMHERSTQYPSYVFVTCRVENAIMVLCVPVRPVRKMKTKKKVHPWDSLLFEIERANSILVKQKLANPLMREWLLPNSADIDNAYVPLYVPMKGAGRIVMGAKPKPPGNPPVPFPPFPMPYPP